MEKRRSRHIKWMEVLRIGVLAWMLGGFGMVRAAEPSSAAALHPLVLGEDGTAKGVIVAPPDAGKVARFAAEELKAYLDRSVDATFAIVDGAPPEGPRILVGDSAESRRLGVTVADLKRDGFVLRRVGDAVVIAGRDDKDFDIRAYAEKGAWKDAGIPECATAFAAYAFLERVAGVRWYFPGKDGEVVSSGPVLRLERLEAREEPHFVYRHLNKMGSRYQGVRCDFADYVDMGINDREVTYWGLRNRASTVNVPLNHMPPYHRWPQRFGKVHPEWFALKETDERDTESGVCRGQLCYSHPGVTQETIKEVDGFFSGQPASAFGLGTWNRVIANGDYFSVLPQDGMRGCRCKACQAKWNPETQWSEMIWRYVAEVGRAIEDKRPGKYVTCLAYSPYNSVPTTVRLPGNILVGVAVQGGGLAREGRQGRLGREDVALIHRWKDLTGNRVVLWTYNCREVAQPTKLPGVPQIEAHALGRFYRAVKDDVMGSFYENDLSCGFQNFINHYVYLRLMWNPETNVDALLHECYEKLYGPAAPAIGKILDRAETLWFERIWVPERDLPIADYRELWEEIYGEEERAKVVAWVDAAEWSAAGTPYASRVALFRTRFLGPLLAQARRYQSERDALMQNAAVMTIYRFAEPPVIDGRLDERGWSPPKGCSSMTTADLDVQSKAPEARTYISLGWDDASLYIRFTCEEDHLSALRMPSRSRDDLGVCEDDSVEVFIDPTAREKGFYHILVNAAGAVADRKVEGPRGDASWDSHARVSTRVDKDKGAWFVELAVPFDSLGGPPKEYEKGKYRGWIVNFTRNRHAHGGKVQHSSWSPFVQDMFNQPEKFGTLIFTPNVISSR